MNFSNFFTKISTMKYQLISYLVLIAIACGLAYGFKTFYDKTIQLEAALKVANTRITELEKENEKIKKSGDISEKSILAILQGEKKIDKESSEIEVAVQNKIDNIRSAYSKVVRVKRTIPISKPKPQVAVTSDNSHQKTASVEAAEIVAEVATVTEYENKISEARIDGLWAAYCRHIPKGTDKGCDKQFDATSTDKSNQIDQNIQKATNHEEVVQ